MPLVVLQCLPCSAAWCTMLLLAAFAPELLLKQASCFCSKHHVTVFRLDVPGSVTAVHLPQPNQAAHLEGACLLLVLVLNTDEQVPLHAWSQGVASAQKEKPDRA